MSGNANLSMTVIYILEQNLDFFNPSGIVLHALLCKSMFLLLLLLEIVHDGMLHLVYNPNIFL
jgi:hypothetical protein